jgi:hypothetical protein
MIAPIINQLPVMKRPFLTNHRAISPAIKMGKTVQKPVNLKMIAPALAKAATIIAAILMTNELRSRRFISSGFSVYDN